jgi:peptidyl-tRNA hydrolase
MKILYILVRTDMDSMRNCPGKGMAQASHATSKFHNAMDNPSGSASWSPEYVEWRNQAGGFGTVLTLGCTEAQMFQAINNAQRAGVPCGIVNDPTYPLRDGATTHFFPVNTCAWVFVDKFESGMIVGNLELHP